MKIEVPKFATKEETFKWLADNVEENIYAKKSSIKEADCMIPTITKIEHINHAVDKAEGGESEPDMIKVRAVINTTNVMDSHGDVHLPKLWNKSLKENKYIKHLEEHKMSFRTIIADKDDLKVFTKEYDWKELGIDAEGKTQALVFDSNVRKSRNPYMYGEYKKENVDNHSVGMQYVSIKMAMNSENEDHAQYKAEWDKHYDSILNKADVDRKGYFWAVYEAKVREGSAVPLGSNHITPTLSRTKDTQGEGEGEAVDKALLPFINFLNKQ
jgi:hypothetical protein